MTPAKERTKERRFIDFCEFSARQLHSGDIDPAYPVIKNFLETYKVPFEKRVWFLIVYVGFYNLKSAVDYSQGEIQDVSKAKYGIERRGFRGNSLVLKHFESFDMGEILKAIKGGDWKEIEATYQKAVYTGTWSSYKFADLCKNVLDLKNGAPDLGLGGKGKNAGPIPGLSLLTEKPWEQCATDFVLQKRFYNKCLLQGVRFTGLEELETCLCDFNSMFKGGYYTGHDIDKQQEDFKGAGEGLWDARHNSFSTQFLGELNGWEGVRKDLKTRYRDEGVI